MWGYIPPEILKQMLEVQARLEYCILLCSEECKGHFARGEMCLQELRELRTELTLDEWLGWLRLQRKVRKGILGGINDGG